MKYPCLVSEYNLPNFNHILKFVMSRNIKGIIHFVRKIILNSLDFLTSLNFELYCL